MADPVLGLDVGGAHLKAALVDADGRLRRAVQLPCPLWRGMDRLEQALSMLSCELAGIDKVRRVAVTMTGELADLFPDRATGVRRISALLDRRFGASRIRLFAPTGFVPAERIDGMTRAIASANWLATARLVAARTESGLLVDIGSTTTDLIPFHDGTVTARGSDDRSRLRYGELVYLGVVRTPLCALGPEVPFEGHPQPLMNEFFATTADVLRLTGELDPGSDMLPAADGGAKDMEASARRLARMVGADLEDASLAAWRALARCFRERMLARLTDAARQVISRSPEECDRFLVTLGCGAFLGGELAARLDRPCRRFGEVLELPEEQHAAAEMAAPAVAVAMLLARQDQE